MTMAQALQAQQYFPIRDWYDSNKRTYRTGSYGNIASPYFRE
jgi:hypothetical protein